MKKTIFDKHEARIKTLKKWEDFYRNKPEQYFQIKESFILSRSDDGRKLQLYLTYPAARMIADHYADLVAGDEIMFISQNEEQQKLIDEFVEKNNIDATSHDVSVQQSKFGYGVMRLRELNGDVILEALPVDSYFPIFDINGNLKEVYLGVYKTIVLENGREKQYFYVQHYYLDVMGEEKQLYIERKLHEVTASGKIGKEVSLSILDSDIPEGAELQEGINFIPIYQINNNQQAGKQYPDSEYMDIESLLGELNDRLSQVSVQFIKHINSKIALPTGSLNKEGEVKLVNNEVFEIPPGGEKPSYITLETSMIQRAIEWIEESLTMIASSKNLAKEVFGIEGKGGAEKVEAMRIRRFPTDKKALRKRKFLKRELERAVRDMLIFKNVTEPEPVDIVFNDVKLVDEEKKSSMIIDQVNNDLLSRHSAMKKLFGYTDDEVEEEKVRIEGETSASLPIPRLALNTNRLNEEETTAGR